MATHTWEDFIGGLNLGSSTVARHLLSEVAAPDWGRAPPEFDALVSPSTVNSSKAMLLRLTLAEEKTYSMTVIGGKVTVLHVMVEPPELSAQGGRFVALAGDIRHVASQTIHPDLVHLDGNNSRTATATHFTTLALPVADWDDINTELEADGTVAFASRLVLSGRQVACRFAILLLDYKLAS